jgi:hypothetical protein
MTRVWMRMINAAAEAVLDKQACVDGAAGLFIPAPIAAYAQAKLSSRARTANTLLPVCTHTYKRTVNNLLRMSRTRNVSRCAQQVAAYAHACL